MALMYLPEYYSGAIVIASSFCNLVVNIASWGEPPNLQHKESYPRISHITLLLFTLYILSIAALSLVAYTLRGTILGIAIFSICFTWIPIARRWDSLTYLDDTRLALLIFGIPSALEVAGIAWFCTDAVLRDIALGIYGRHSNEWIAHLCLCSTSILLSVFCNAYWVRFQKQRILERSMSCSVTTTGEADINSFMDSAAEARIRYSVINSWFLTTLNTGSKCPLKLDDLPLLPYTMSSSVCGLLLKLFSREIFDAGNESPYLSHYDVTCISEGAADVPAVDWLGPAAPSSDIPKDAQTIKRTQVSAALRWEGDDNRTTAAAAAAGSMAITGITGGCPSASDSSDNAQREISLGRAVWQLVRIAWRIHRSSIMSLGVLKFLICLASFVGPLMLGTMVKYVESDESSRNLWYGLGLVALLGASFVFSASLNIMFNIRASIMQMKLVGGLTTTVFARALSLPLYALTDLQLTDAQLVNIVQVDIENAAGIIRGLNDLWTLPVQIIIAFILLYMQVKMAFLAGVTIILIMIPINSVITHRINTATNNLMKHKDARVQVVTEALRCMRSAKMCGLEDIIIALSDKHRRKELLYLSRRKYLDAICVFLWASMPVLVPFATFTVTVLSGQRLTASSVFTSLSLLNMLIFPMNALPWVVNGIVEARVSIRRIVRILSSSDGKVLYFDAGSTSAPSGYSGRERAVHELEEDDNDDEEGYGNHEEDAYRSIRADRVRLDSGENWNIWRHDDEHQHHHHNQETDENGKAPSVGIAGPHIGENTGVADTGIKGSKKVDSAESTLKYPTSSAEKSTSSPSSPTTTQNVNVPVTVTPVPAAHNKDVIPTPTLPHSTISPMTTGNVRSAPTTVGADADSDILLTVSGASWTWRSCHPGAAPSSASTASNTQASSNTPLSVHLDSSASDLDGFDLGPIEFQGKKGQLLAIVGGVASGKSTLLLGCLGEVRRLAGSVEFAPRIPHTVKARNGRAYASSFHTAGSGKGSTHFSVSTSTSPRSHPDDASSVSMSASMSSSSALLAGLRETVDSSSDSDFDRSDELDDSSIEDRTSSNPFASAFTAGPASYCPQIPSVHSGKSVRDNIIMGAAFDGGRYMEVLQGCCLDADCKSWPDGDLTIVAPNGGNLSGGQRLRIGVARAIYARTHSILLDDPFSALDAVTSKKLSRFLEQECRLHRRLIILSTHSLQFVHKKASGIIFLDRGRQMSPCTPFVELLKTCSTFRKVIGSSVEFTSVALKDLDLDTRTIQDIIATQEELRSSRGAGAGAAAVAKQATSTPMKVASIRYESFGEGTPMKSPLLSGEKRENTDDRKSNNQQAEMGKEGGKDEEEPDRENMLFERMEVGKIDSSVYMAYFQAAGMSLCCAVLLSTAVMQMSSNGMAFWLAYWTEHPKPIVDHANHLYASLHVPRFRPQLPHTISDTLFLKIAACIVCINVISTLFRSFLFARGGLRAATTIYRSLTSAVFLTDISFFERTSVGKIVNRFGTDTERVDDQLPFMLNIVLAQVFLLLGSFLVIAITDPLVVVVIAIVALAYYRLQAFYRTSSRQLRRLGSVLKSPVYALVAECFSNAPTIRALNCGAVFVQELAGHLDNTLRVSLSSCLASQWLDLRLQLLGAVIATSLALSAVITTYVGFEAVSPSLLGLSLSYCFSVVNNLNGLIGSLTETEKEMVSVERIMEYTNLPSEYANESSAGSSDQSSSNSDEARGLTPSKRRASGVSAIWSSKNVSRALQEPLLKLEEEEDDEEEGFRHEHLGSSASSASSPLKGISGIKWIAIEEVGGRQSTDRRSPRRDNTTETLAIRSGEITFTRVSMRYAPNAPLALKEISVSVPSGSRVAIAGRTGSGKSTLLRLLLRLNDYTGSIRLGDCELRTIRRRTLRNQLCVIPQDPFLFSGTIRSNLDPRGDVSDDALVDALRQCGFADTLSFNNNGTPLAATAPLEAQLLAGTKSEDSSINAQLRMLLDMEISSGGERLSQGQRQLLCLGKALAVKNAKVFLLDEATAAVDPVSEAALHRALGAHCQKTSATLLVVCHKIDSVKGLCNKILRLQDGEIVCFSDFDSQ